MCTDSPKSLTKGTNMEDRKKANRLINEKSPYLLQHAFNPVDWFPWGNEAFEKAETEDKPIFLSIGYSTCHWCHVMEKESFEDSVVANLMNEVFISIKVDREERPDIDNIYMTVCQMLTGSGGWPLTIIMTPDKKPFFAGTYFPKEARFGRIGMVDLTNRINEAWKTNREKIYESAGNILSALADLNDAKGEKEIDPEILNLANIQLNKRFDNEYGGFGLAPKFPSPHNLTFLLRQWKRTGDQQALNMVENTLTQMYNGGMYDHVGYGFHRYSTDREWLVPHFEKMLYDQATLLDACIETYQATGNQKYARIADEIITYVLRDMTSTEGGFYSAEDADSEGEEGKFYLWTKDEIEEILDKESAELFIETFNISSKGNYIDEMTVSRNGKNIPHLSKNSDNVIKTLNAKIIEIKEKLFAVREKRIHPHKDDKILTDWNGLMIASLAKASRALNNNQYLICAEKSMDFILAKLRTDEGRLIHRYRDGEAGISANIDDYAFTICGLLELYESNFKTFYISLAIELQEQQIKYFWDEENNGFFFTPNDGEELLTRTKEIYDGAIPSGNSISLKNLIKLSRLTSNTQYEKYASELSRAFSEKLSKSPISSTMMIQGVDFAKGPSFEILIVSDDKEKQKKALKSLNQIFIPNKVVLLKNKENESEIEKIAPFVSEYSITENQIMIYVCQNYICNLPTDDPIKMLKMLNENT